jgi:putative transposase
MHPDYKYKQKYNPKSNRLQNYDYSSNWWYFITICTKNKEHYFGKIQNGKMILNEYGKIIEKYFLEIPQHFINVVLDEYIIMPNHIHGILIINNINNNNNCKDVAMLHLYGSNNNSNNNNNSNSNNNNSNNDYNDNNYKNVAMPHLYDYDFSNISPKKWELWTIIRSFKSICTKMINKLNYVYFAWQPNYYDRIIRNQNELQRIQKYIMENSLKWEKDKENTENLYM